MRTFAAALATITLFGCGFSSSTASLEESFTVEGTPRIFVTTFNGEIRALSGASGEVRFSSVRRGEGLTEDESEHDMDNIEVVSRQEGDDIFITARRLDRGDGGSADISLTFPAGAALELRTSNAPITVKGAGALMARTSNAIISATGLTGNADVQTSDGGIELGAETPIRVTALASNGLLRYTGPLAEGQNTFRTTNNGLELSLPPASEFNLIARTTNGGISVDFPIRQDTGTSTEHVRGTVGENPPVSVEAETTNGRITIKRG